MEHLSGIATTALIIIGLGLVLLVFVGWSIESAKKPECPKLDTQADPALPIRFELVPIEARWTDGKVAAELTCHLESIGYKLIGDFDIPGFMQGGMKIRAYANEAASTFAIFYEHPITRQLINDLTCDLHSGLALYVSNCPENGYPKPEFVRCERMRSISD